MITTTSLTKTFRTADGRAVRALDDVSITVPAGQVFGVVGQSGAGKSTLIRSVNLLERPDSGTVEVAGENLTALSDRELRRARRRIGMVFQHFNLLGSRTARGNVELPLEVLGVGAPERRRRALEMLDLVGLADRADAHPSQLSGGQKQRVGIARALATRPQVLLSDEATSALDPETTRAILDLVVRISRELGLTVLLITHEMDVVKRICDAAALLQEGRVVEQGTLTELIRTPGSELARELFPLGELPDHVDGTVVDITFAGGTADRPVIAQLARNHGLDVSILGATIEHIAGTQAGRTRLALPGSPDAIRTAIEDLRSQGLLVEIVQGARS